MKCGSGMFLSLQLLDDAEAVQSGHLDVQEHDVRLQGLDQFDGFQAVAPGGQDLDFGKFLEQKRQLFARQALIVNQDRRDCAGRAGCHKMLV